MIENINKIIKNNRREVEATEHYFNNSFKVEIYSLNSDLTYKKCESLEDAKDENPYFIVLIIKYLWGYPHKKILNPTINTILLFDSYKISEKGFEVLNIIPVQGTDPIYGPFQKKYIKIEFSKKGGVEESIYSNYSEIRGLVEVLVLFRIKINYFDLD